MPSRLELRRVFQHQGSTLSKAFNSQPHFLRLSRRPTQSSDSPSLVMDLSTPLSPAMSKGGEALPLGFSELLQHNAAVSSVPQETGTADSIQVQSQASSRYGTPIPQSQASQSFDPYQHHQRGGNQMVYISSDADAELIWLTGLVRLGITRACINTITARTDPSQRCVMMSC